MRVLARCLTIGGLWALTCQNILLHNPVLALIYMAMSGLFLILLSEDVRKQCKWLAVLMLSISGAFADGPTTNQLMLTWDVLPQYSTNDTFYIYSSTNVGQPMSQWLSVTSITFKQFMVGTNVPIPPATDTLRFYTFVSSNLTGRSDFAEPDSCRLLPSGTGLKIGKR